MKSKRTSLGVFLLTMAVLCCPTTLFGQENYDHNVGAYYYPWYSPTNPDMSFTLRDRLVPKQEPTVGWGSQAATIGQHYDWARAGGVDHFDCSFWGEGDTGDVLMRDHMLPHPNRGDIKLSVFLETITSDTHAAVTLGTVYDEMAYLANNYFNQDGYYTIDNKPVVHVYLTRVMSNTNLHTYTNLMRDAAADNGYSDIYIVGDEVWKGSPSSASRLVGCLDAVTNYDVYGNIGATGYASTSSLNTWDSWNASWQTACDGMGVDFIPGVAPGYNDRAVRDGHNALSRKFGSGSSEFGSLFEEQLIRAKDNTDVDIGRAIMVTSWNEWYEDSQIEPVSGGATTNVDDSATGNHYTQDLYYESYGTRYLDILREQAGPEIPTVTLDIVDEGCPETGLHRYTLTATGDGITTLSEFTIDGEVHQVFDGETPSEWRGDGSASELETTDSHVIFGDLRIPDLGGETWPGPGDPPAQVTEETINGGGGGSGMGTLNNFDDSVVAIHDSYMELGPPPGEGTVELLQLVVADGGGFSINGLTILTSTEYDSETGESTILTFDGLTFSLAALTPGDADGDGDVDADDISILAQHWLQESSTICWADGDFNGDGAVNDIDATILAANWNPGTASVPEPSTLVLLAGMLLAMVLRRRK